MKFSGKVIAMLAIGAGLASPVFGAGIGLSGPHYNLNIIGVENPKNSTWLKARLPSLSDSFWSRPD